MNLGREPVSLAAMGLDDIVVATFVVNLIKADHQSLKGHQGDLNALDHQLVAMIVISMGSG